jgi:ADP-heptose:LPS heptosyltransferase
MLRVWHVLRRLRRERYDCVLTLRRDLDDALFARLCGGRRTVGFYARRTKPFLSGWEHFRPDRHTVENHLRLMTQLGCEPDGLTPRVSVTSDSASRIDALLAGTSPEQPLLGLAPFGSSEAKSWEAGRTAALIDSLPKAGVVLLGGPEDRPRAATVCSRTSAPAIDLVGRTSIPELCDILRRCRLLVCVDSGPMHLAGALGIPTVALFGHEDPGLWGPYGETPHRILRAANGSGRASPQAISVGMVLEAVSDLLEATGGPPDHAPAHVEESL